MFLMAMYSCMNGLIFWHGMGAAPPRTPTWIYTRVVSFTSHLDGLVFHVSASLNEVHNLSRCPQSCEPWSRTCEPCSLTCEPWSRTCEPWSLTCEPWSWTCEPWSLTCETWSRTCEPWSRTCEPWSPTCEPWSRTCEPWSRMHLVAKF